MNAAMDTAGRPVRIAVDIGGTFTDLQIFDGRSGAVWSHKVSTTPADPSIGFMRGIAEAADRYGFALAYLVRERNRILEALDEAHEAGARFLGAADVRW